MEVGHEDVFRKLAADLDYRADKTTIRAKMAELMGLAKEQLLTELPRAAIASSRVASIGRWRALEQVTASPCGRARR